MIEDDADAPKKPINGSPIIRGNRMQVYCSCVVDLISKVQRPYLFRATVIGKPPHAYQRVYDIAAWSDDAAAHLALEVFEREMADPLMRILLGDVPVKPAGKRGH